MISGTRRVRQTHRKLGAVVLSLPLSSPRSWKRVSVGRITEQHRIRAEAFGRRYGIDLWALAAEFARRSPDWEMRASLKLVSPEELGG